MALYKSFQPQERLTVIVIGGSISGLLCGIALKRSGHRVRILEHQASERESHGTGLGLGCSAHAFLEEYDRHIEPFAHRVQNLQLLRQDGRLQILATGRRDITSWDALFYRLRSLFDGFPSQHYPDPPEDLHTNGLAIYESNRTLIEVLNCPDGDHPLEVIVQDNTSQDIECLRADVVIGADGPNSRVRAIFMPNITRRYAGYIMWRGLVPETEVSTETHQMFEKSIIAHKTGQQHCLMYMIPGANGSLKTGERLLNFVWYTNESHIDLENIMLDGLTGHRHHNFVPPGRVREDIWTKRLHIAREVPLPQPFLEVLDKINQPSVQVVTDYCSPSAAFASGRVLLAGDSVSLFRPHAALGVSQAAFHARAIDEYLNDKISLEDWESRVLRRSYLHWTMNVWWGNFYQASLLKALPFAIRYWAYAGFYTLASWWRGELGLL